MRKELTRWFVQFIKVAPFALLCNALVFVVSSTSDALVWNGHWFGALLGTGAIIVVSLMVTPYSEMTWSERHAQILEGE